MFTMLKKMFKEFEKLKTEVRIFSSATEKIYIMSFQPELLEEIKKYQDDVMKQKVNESTEEDH